MQLNQDQVVAYQSTGLVLLSCSRPQKDYCMVQQPLSNPSCGEAQTTSTGGGARPPHCHPNHNTASPRSPPNQKTYLQSSSQSTNFGNLCLLLPNLSLIQLSASFPVSVLCYFVTSRAHRINELPDAVRQHTSSLIRLHHHCSWH